MRLAVGLAMTLVAFLVAGRRVYYLYRLIGTGQPATGRLDDLGTRVRSELREVLGQRKLLKWSVPGAAHFFTFWAFVVLAATILEAYGALFTPDFAIPVIGRWTVLGFLEDFFGVAVLVAIVCFAILRIRQAPSRQARGSRFYGSHTGAAWLVLLMIFNVVWTLFLYRGAQINTGNFPFQDSGWWTFASRATANVLEPLGENANEVLETVGILLQIGVVLGFLVLVVYSKHLHIFLAPVNVLTKREPNALGPLLPVMVGGQPVDFDNLEDLGDDLVLGRGKVEDFTWKGMLDFATCTECGRCQSQCPAWNTDKPLSPKLLIMALRDHAFAKAPYMIAKEHPTYLASTGGAPQAAPIELTSFPASVRAEVERPLVGETEGDPWLPSGGGVIDPDVLWSCVTCGACVEQCPVDIEHVDHITDMRRFQVMIEDSFPKELGGLFKNLEKAGNPWGINASQRLEWAKELPFEVKQVGVDVEDLSEVDYLFWVGCAGAFEDRAKKTTQAVAELLHTAGVSFAVLGDGETCTGDSARRAGNEFLYQMFAQQNTEALREVGAKRVVVTCAHCFNALGNEYPQLGLELEVVHHSQLLDQLVRERRLVPVADPAANGAGGLPVTYHDPCYLGRHNGVYAPPRELIGAVPGLELREMPRHGDRSFCCGAGGARMWMEEQIGTRINETRTAEALGTGAERIAIACPFCRVMLSDGLTAAQAAGTAPETTQVVDVSQLLLDAVRRGAPSA